MTEMPQSENRNNSISASDDDRNKLLFGLNDLPRFVESYQRYAESSLIPIRARIIELLSRWRRANYWNKLVIRAGEPAPSPIQRIQTRIKQPGAVVRKVLARPERFPDGLQERIFEQVTDALGVRVVAYFLSSLPLIDREIRECGWFNISEKHPPHAYLQRSTADSLGLNMECHTKASGYNSIHYVLQLKQEYSEGHSSPWFELQLRTLTQDLWAEVEHLLGYKYRTSTPAVRAQLNLIGHLLGTIDEYFDAMADDLARSQSLEPPNDTTPLTADNLPGLLAAAGLTCSQYDLNGLLKIATGCDIKTVRDLRHALTRDNIKLVSSVARQTLGRDPADAELVPALLIIANMPTDQRDLILGRMTDIIKAFEATL